MLRLQADDYRIEALLIAKAEAQRRQLDLDVLEDELRGIRSHPHPGSAGPALPPSLEQTAPLEFARLAPLWIWIPVIAAGIALEAVIVVLEVQADRNWRWGMLGMSLLGFAVYLVAVQRMHRALGLATGGRYPIAPAKAVGMHFVPLFGFVWPFLWGAEIARFVERNGGGRRFEGWVPGVLFLAAYVLGYIDGVLRLVLLCATVVFVQLRLRHGMRDARMNEVKPSDWSSSALG
jgi:hypothetical protein